MQGLRNWFYKSANRQIILKPASIKENRQNLVGIIHCVSLWGAYDEECHDINKYFMEFAYTFDKDKFVPGWLYQIRNTVSPGTFMFDSKAFPDTKPELKKLDVGALFLDKKYHWPSGGLMSGRYDKFIKELIESDPKDEQKVNTTKEKFLEIKLLRNHSLN